MNERNFETRQVLDWSAAVWAGLLAGLIFLIVGVVASWLALADPWFVVRLIASSVLGPDVVPKPSELNTSILVVGMIAHFLLSILFALLVAFIVHRWGFVISFFGGALIGLAFYAINFYTMSYFFPWIFPLRNWIMLLSHVIFGAFAGAIYEMLEVETFVPVAEPERATPS